MSVSASTIRHKTTCKRFDAILPLDISLVTIPIYLDLIGKAIYTALTTIYFFNPES